jgi:predicted dehydrogenase
VEKPITTNYDEAQDLFNIAAQKNLVIHIGHVERFNGAVQELKNIVNTPRLIEARRVGPFNPNFKNDSIVLDLMIHDIDIALNVAGKPVVAVQAMGAPVYTSLADYASVNIYFGDSTTAHITASRINQNKERYMNVIQDDALIVLDYTNQDINITRKGQYQHIFGDKELKYKNEYIQERLFVYKENPLQLEITHFVECVIGKATRMVSVEHDLRSLRVALEVDSLLLNGCYGCKTL